MLNNVDAPPVEILSANGGLGTNYTNVLGFGPDFTGGALKWLEVPNENVELWDVFRQRQWFRISGTLSPTLTVNLYWEGADQSGGFGVDALVTSVAVPVPNTTTRALLETDIQIIALTGSGSFADPWSIRLRAWLRLTTDDRTRFAFGDWTHNGPSGALRGDYFVIQTAYAFSAANVSNTLREELGTWDRLRGARLT